MWKQPKHLMHWVSWEIEPETELLGGSGGVCSQEQRGKEGWEPDERKGRLRWPGISKISQYTVSSQEGWPLSIELN